MTDSLLSPAGIAEAAEDAMAHKALNDPRREFLLALPGGGFIALGFIFFVTCLTGAQDLPWGMARLVGGLAFSTGLFLVVVTGADLFTSTTMSLMAKAAGRISWLQLARHWAVVYLGNALGAATIVALAWFGGLAHNAGGAWGRTLVGAAAGKMHHGVVEAFFLGILCNVCVCVAIWVGFAGRSVTDKFVAVAGPVALFVASGFEHSVANMFLVPLAVLVQDFGHVPGLADAHLTWSGFLLRNLLPVTLGNIVGGGLMIGMLNWVIHRYRAQRATH